MVAEMLAGSLPLSSSLHSISSGEDFSSQPPGDAPEAQAVDILFLVVQGGAALQPDPGPGQTIDYHTLRSNLATVAELHFRSAVGRWAVRQVPCPNLTTAAYQTLCEVSRVMLNDVM